MSEETTTVDVDDLPEYLGTIDYLAESLRRFRYTTVRRERDLSEAVQTVLRDHIRCNFVPEYFINGKHDRVDFYLPWSQIGIELKVVGQPSYVIRQLLRYAQSKEISGLILVTTKGRSIAHLPKTLNGKPVFVVNVGMGGVL